MYIEIVDTDDNESDALAPNNTGRITEMGWSRYNDTIFGQPNNHNKSNKNNNDDMEVDNNHNKNNKNNNYNE